MYYQYAALLNTSIKCNIKYFYATLGQDILNVSCFDSSFYNISLSHFVSDLQAILDAFHYKVEMNISKLTLHGAPGSGKTSLLNLIMGNPPPKQRNSTGCIEPPARGIVTGSIATDGYLWEKVDTRKMLEIVCQTLKKKIDEVSSELSAKDSVSHHTTNHNAQPLSKNSIFTGFLEMFSWFLEVFCQFLDELLIWLGKSMPSHSFSEPEPPTAEMLTRLYDVLPNATGSTQLFSVHWVFTTDSGGQPHFQDVAPLFLRGNSLNIITVKLNERLDDKPEFSYYIKGKPVQLSNSLLQLTNLQLIESLAKSVSSVKPSNISVAKSSPEKPKFMIVGSFKDKADDCDETITEKNRRLRRHLENYKAVRVDDGSSVIFPVNTINPNEMERKKAARQLQQRITSTTGTTMQVEVPIKWFGLLLELILLAEKQNKSLLHLNDCIAAGKFLEIDEKEVLTVLQFFHELNLVMHFPTDNLKHVVFVDVKPVLDKLSLLVGISFISKDMLDDIIKPNLPLDAQDRLKDHGLFSKELLENHFEFSSLLTPDVFLDVLLHLGVVAPIKKRGAIEFFLPCALSYASEKEIRERKVSKYPWIIRLWSTQGATPIRVPIPKGLFPSLIVHLLSSSNLTAELSPIQSQFSQQYRNAISLVYFHLGFLHLIESHLQLEVYYSLDEQCSEIRLAVLEGITAVVKKLHFASDAFTVEDAFLCSCNDSNNVCIISQQNQQPLCEKNRMPHELEPQNMRWLRPTKGIHYVNHQAHITSSEAYLLHMLLL